MGRVVLVCVVACGLVLGAGVALAATDITNVCTGQYQVIGRDLTASGMDDAIGRLQSAPALTIAKSITNLRTGQSSGTSVNILSGDTVEFTIVWSNTGEATADTVVLTDYVPQGFTFYALSGDTIANGVKVSYTGGAEVKYIANSVQGTDPGPAGNGIFKFRATVD